MGHKTVCRRCGEWLLAFVWPKRKRHVWGGVTYEDATRAYRDYWASAVEGMYNAPVRLPVLHQRTRQPSSRPPFPES